MKDFFFLKKRKILRRFIILQKSGSTQIRLILHKYITTLLSDLCYFHTFFSKKTPHLFKSPQRCPKEPPVTYQSYFGSSTIHSPWMHSDSGCIPPSSHVLPTLQWPIYSHTASICRINLFCGIKLRSRRGGTLGCCGICRSAAAPHVRSRSATDVSSMATKEVVSWVFSAICEVLNWNASIKVNFISLSLSGSLSRPFICLFLCREKWNVSWIRKRRKRSVINNNAKSVALKIDVYTPDFVCGLSVDSKEALMVCL